MEAMSAATHTARDAPSYQRGNAALSSQSAASTDIAGATLTTSELPGRRRAA